MESDGVFSFFFGDYDNYREIRLHTKELQPKESESARQIAKFLPKGDCSTQ